MEPILKWAGGKRQLLKELLKHVSRSDLENHTYFEPFLGGGALLLRLAPKNAVVNDVNLELVGVYSVIRDQPEQLIEQLKIYKRGYPDNYEEIRSLDRKNDFLKLSPVVRAARFIYLNKTCYNGLYRVNSQGFFNVPKGRYKNPDINNERKIRELSGYLKKNKIRIMNVDFSKAVSTAKAGDFVYFDPPYDYENKGFTTYSADGFTRDDLIRLKNTCDKLVEKGCIVMVSNNDTTFVNELFSNGFYEINRVEANRFINCDGKRRTKAREVIIYGRKK